MRSMLLSTYDFIASHTAGLDWKITNEIQKWPSCNIFWCLIFLKLKMLWKLIVWYSIYTVFIGNIDDENVHRLSTENKALYLLDDYSWHFFHIACLFSF